MTAASLAGSHNSDSPIRVIQQVMLRNADSSSRGHCPAGTRRLSPRNTASSASSAPPAIPVQPRADSGGHSTRMYFMIGQLRPQPTEVMARNIRPAGAMRARALAWISMVMESGPGGNRGHLAGYRTRKPSQRWHASPDFPVAPRESFRRNPTPTKYTCPVNSGAKPEMGASGTIFSLGNPSGLTDTWGYRGSRRPPVFPGFPPYLVFDSGTHTN